MPGLCLEEVAILTNLSQPFQRVGSPWGDQCNECQPCESRNIWPELKGLEKYIIVSKQGFVIIVTIRTCYTNATITLNNDEARQSYNHGPVLYNFYGLI
jgi:hypothetical protein